MIVYPFPKITINPEEIVEFVKKSFIDKFGEGNLISVELETYPNEYSIDLIVSKKDKAVSMFVDELRKLL